MENPARPRCKYRSSQPWLGFLAERGPGLTRWHAAVPLGVSAATFQPGYFLHPLLLKRKQGRRAAGTQRSYPGYNTSHTKEQVGQEVWLQATGREERWWIHHRQLRSLLPNEQNVAVRFLITLHLLPGCWGRHRGGILSFFAFLFHPNPRDPCPCLSGASSTSSFLKPLLFLPLGSPCSHCITPCLLPGSAWQAAAWRWHGCQSPGHPQGWE